VCIGFKHIGMHFPFDILHFTFVLFHFTFVPLQNGPGLHREGKAGDTEGAAGCNDGCPYARSGAAGKASSDELMTSSSGRFVYMYLYGYTHAAYKTYPATVHAFLSLQVHHLCRHIYIHTHIYMYVYVRERCGYADKLIHLCIYTARKDIFTSAHLTWFRMFKLHVNCKLQV